MAKRKAKQKRLMFSNEFYSDLEADDMLYAALIRSPVASGKLLSLVPPSLPKGYHLFDATDIIGKKVITTLGMETPVFCTGDIAYQGEPLGILVGENEKTVHTLAVQTEVQYEERIAPEESVIAERTVQTNPNIDELFAQADFVVEDTWLSRLRPPSYSEPNGAFVVPKGGALNVFTPSQWLSHLRASLSDVTAVDAESIFITRTQYSELDTNTLWINSVLAAQVSTAVCKTGKPIKLVLSRAEQEQFIERIAPVHITHRTAVSKTGDIIAADIDIKVDGGAYNPFVHEFLDRLVIASCGIYNPRNLRIKGIAVRSAKSPYSIDLATIDAQAFFAIENHIQKISEVTGIHPLELREKNYRANEKKPLFVPFQFAAEKVMDTLDAVSRTSDFNRKYVAYRMDEKGRYLQDNNSPFAPPLRGTGLACAFGGSGYIGTNFIRGNPSIEVTLEKDGTLHIHALPTSHSVWKIWTKVVGDTLGIDERNIVLNSEFETAKEPESPDTINSNISIMTQLLKNVCETIKRKKDGGALPLTIKKTLSPTKKKQWDKEAFAGNPFYSTAFAACVVEVELDACTYKEQVRGIWVVVNGGKILSVRAAENTIKAAIQETLRELVADDTVRCDNIRIQFMQSDDEPKQIGDIVYAILPAAFSSALSQALAITVNRLPLQSDKLYRLTKTAQQLTLDKLEAERLAAQAKEYDETQTTEASAENGADV